MQNEVHVTCIQHAKSEHYMHTCAINLPIICSCQMHVICRDNACMNKPLLLMAYTYVTSHPPTHSVFPTENLPSAHFCKNVHVHLHDYMCMHAHKSSIFYIVKLTIVIKIKTKS